MRTTQSSHFRYNLTCMHWGGFIKLAVRTSISSNGPFPIKRSRPRNAVFTPLGPNSCRHTPRNAILPLCGIRALQSPSHRIDTHFPHPRFQNPLYLGYTLLIKHLGGETMGIGMITRNWSMMGEKRDSSFSFAFEVAQPIRVRSRGAPYMIILSRQ